MRKNILCDVRLPFISRQGNIDIELRQAEEEGKDVTPFRGEAKRVADMPVGSAAEDAALALCEALRLAPIRNGYPYREPETLNEIEALFPKDASASVPDDISDRLLGAILGRAAGCLLGQPVEGWTRERIVGLAKATGNDPITRYFSSNITNELRERFDVRDEPGAYGNLQKSWLNNIKCAPEDDDTNYTLMGLEVMEQYGADFTPMDVAECLTTNVPVFLTCTAERIAYKNIVNGITPPESALYGNPYREWLGAQIRVDGYAYACPGQPARAARMAIRDASVTHAKNGIYASAFCAALISLCAVEKDMRQAIRRAMSFIPAESRLREALDDFLRHEALGAADEELIGYVHHRYRETDKHDWCHVIPNDMLILLALLRGGRDFTRVVGLAVEAGFDTDCNAATAGSAFGMMYGSAAIPAQWTEPMRGEVISRIGSGGKIRFTDIAERFHKLVLLNF